jgi:hypothetical protein
MLLLLASLLRALTKTVVLGGGDTFPLNSTTMDREKDSMEAIISD